MQVDEKPNEIGDAPLAARAPEPAARRRAWHPRAVLDRLDHLILAVRDLDGAEAAYTRLLGRRSSWRGEHPAAGTANVLFRLDNCYVELLAATGEGPIAAWLSQHLDAHGEGVAGLAFGTPDAEACYAEWKERGLDPAPPQPGLGRDHESGAFREWTNVHLPPSQTRGVLVFAIEHRSPADILPEAPLWTDAESAVSGLDHVVVMSRDPDATRALYADALGLRLALDQERPEWKARQLFFRVGGVTVEVGARLGAEPEPDADDELWGLAWKVPDAAAAHARIADAQRVDALRDGRKPGTRVFTVKDGSCSVPTLMIEHIGR